MAEAIAPGTPIHGPGRRPPLVGPRGTSVAKGGARHPTASHEERDIRRQRFSGAATLPYSELEYGGIVDILERLEKRLRIRPAAKPETVSA